MHHENHLHTSDVEELEGCDCKVKIKFHEKSDRFGKSVFIENVNHKTGALAFRQIKGEKRSLEKQTYKNNINITPSKNIELNIEY